MRNLTQWKTAMAYQYLFVCLFDFFMAPVGLSIYALIRDVPYISWEPLTLVNGGLYHIAMGAILGISAWSRKGVADDKRELGG